MCCSLRSLCESHGGQLPAECQNFTVHQPPDKPSVDYLGLVGGFFLVDNCCTIFIYFLFYDFYADSPQVPTNKSSVQSYIGVYTGL